MRPRIIIAGLALTAVISCTKNIIDVAPADGRIGYVTVVGTSKPESKTLINGTDYPVAETFGTSAFMTRGDFNPENPSSAGLYIDNREVAFFSAEKMWTTAKRLSDDGTGTGGMVMDTYYWPDNKEVADDADRLKLTFFSYSPYSVSDYVAVDAANGVTITDYDLTAEGAQDIDLMVAGRVTAMSNDTQKEGMERGVNTVFHHILSQIVGFNIKSKEATAKGKETFGKGDIRIFVKEVLINICPVGTYVSTNMVGVGGRTGAWTKSANISEVNLDHIWYRYVPEEGRETEEGLEIGMTDIQVPRTEGEPNDYILVIPQDFQSAAGNYGEEAHLEVLFEIWQYYGSGKNDYVRASRLSGATLYDIHAGSHSIGMNKKVTYGITIDVQRNELFFAPSLVNWDTITEDGNLNPNEKE